MTTPAITGLSLSELSDWLAQHHQPAYRAAQIFEWVYKRRVRSFEEMSNLPQELRKALSTQFAFHTLKLVRKLGSNDTTQKFLFELADKQLVESVLIPASPALYGEKSDRRTLCVSSQVGCAYGCKFCASGLNGWTRNLTPGEIVEQILQAESISGERVDNLVFMGMGEPLANFNHLITALQILNAPWGLTIGARRITISTSGLAPQIKKLADMPMQIRLAVSLHGATDEVREKIMPVNKKHPIAELLEACHYWKTKKNQRLTFEYILIRDINDSLAQARALSSIALELDARVNLIPYNTVEGLPWERPSLDQQFDFAKVLHQRGVTATLRREKGHDINAACGQLRRQTLQDHS